MRTCQPKEKYADLTEEFCYYDVDGSIVSGTHVIDADDDGSLIQERWLDADGNSVDPTTVIEAECPEPSSLELPDVDIEDCDGNITSEEAMPVAVKGVVYVKNCQSTAVGDYEFLCKKDGTGFVLGWGDPETQSLNLTEIDGTPFAGTMADVGACAKSLESDDVAWCVDGADFNQHIVKDNGEPTGDAFWTDAMGAVAASPLAAATAYKKGSCEAATQCTPYMASALGEATPAFQPFNEFTIKKPSCCALTVTTPAGSITIPKGVEAFSSSKFDCAIDSIELSGCDITDVTVIVFNSGNN